MKNTGFTLLELIISLALLSVVSVLGFVVLSASASVMNLAATQTTVDAELRDVVNAMRGELQLASKTSNAALTPALAAIAVNANPVAGSPVELAFQIPRDASGTNWSTTIRYRFISEDANGNGRLDAGEDTDGDKVLTRRIVRIQDMNGNGSTADPGEIRTLGGCNDLSAVTFALDATRSIVTVTLNASRRVSNNTKRPPVTASISTNIYLKN